MAGAGIQSELDVEMSPTVPGAFQTKPHVWSWIWFFVAVAIVMGFHIRMFGRAVPPSASFP